MINGKCQMNQKMTNPEIFGDQNLGFLGFWIHLPAGRPAGILVFEV